MYINDIHIAYYAIAIIASIFIGQLVDWANKRMPEYKKVKSKDIIQNGIQTKLFANANNSNNICNTIIYLWNKTNTYSKFRFNKIYNNITNVSISICYRL